MSSDSAPDQPRPFRVCPECGRLTPTSSPNCVACGAVSVQAMAEQAERDNERRFAEAFFRRGTSATWALIGANVAVFILMALAAGTVDGDDPRYLVTLVNFGAKVNELIDRGEYWRLVTPIFIHIGAFHLLVNMYSLYMIGPAVERLYGTARYVLLYLLTGIGGVLGSYFFFNGQNGGVSAGASGALFGLLGVLLVFGVKYRNELPGVFRQAFSPGQFIPVLLLNLLITFTIPVIDKWAHLGGLFTGAVLAAVVPYAAGERRARLFWWVAASVCVATIVGSFALAFSTPKRSQQEIEKILEASLGSGTARLKSDLIEPFNQSSGAMNDVFEGLATAYKRQAVNVPQVVERARAAAALASGAAGVDERSKALLGRQGDLLGRAASLLEGDRTAINEASLTALVNDRKQLQADWDAWFKEVGAPDFGLQLKDDNDTSGGSDGN